jgi:hypothetical protein
LEGLDPEEREGFDERGVDGFGVALGVALGVARALGRSPVDRLPLDASGRAAAAGASRRRGVTSAGSRRAMSRPVVTSGVRVPKPAVVRGIRSRGSTNGGGGTGRLNEKPPTLRAGT